MPTKLLTNVASTVKAILHASRDCMRNQMIDSISIPYDTTSGYYGEAFGIMRAVALQGYGYWGSSNRDAVQEGRSKQPEANLKWWMGELERIVLEEENFGGSGVCVYCKGRYRKDDSDELERRRLLAICGRLVEALRETENATDAEYVPF